MLKYTLVAHFYTVRYLLRLLSTESREWERAVGKRTARVHLWRHEGKTIGNRGKTWLVLTAKSRRALLPPSTRFYEVLQTDPPLPPAKRGTGDRGLCSPCRLHCSFFHPPVAVHDISTMETARARSLLSHSTSFRTRLSNLAADYSRLPPIPPCSPLIFPLLSSCHLASSSSSSSTCSVFRVDRGGIEHILYPSSASFHFLSPREVANSGQTSQSFSRRFVG